jgi:hypothetical protein
MNEKRKRGIDAVFDVIAEECLEINFAYYSIYNGGTAKRHEERNDPEESCL